MPMSPFFISVNDLIARIGTAQAPMLFDTCRAKAFASANRVVAGAKWRAHSAIDDWITEIPEGADVVVNCVHGHQMSQSTVARLRQLGVNARVLAGGIDGYIEAGGVTIEKSDTLPQFPRTGDTLGDAGTARKSTGSPAPGSSGASSIPRRKSFSSRPIG